MFNTRSKAVNKIRSGKLYIYLNDNDLPSKIAESVRTVSLCLISLVETRARPSPGLLVILGQNNWIKFL